MERRTDLRVFVWACVVNLALMILGFVTVRDWPREAESLLWVVATPPMALHSIGLGFGWNLWLWLVVNPLVYGSTWWLVWRMWKLWRAKPQE